MTKSRNIVPMLILTALTVLSMPLAAQQPRTLQPRMAEVGPAPEEDLSYELLFNWKFVWIKAGTARLLTRSVDYEGRRASETTLFVHTSKKADAIFLLRDTITAVLSPDQDPLFYYKHCREGDGQVNEKAWYSRPAPGRFQVRQRKIYNNGTVRQTDTVCSQPVYDMISMIQCARHSDFSTLNDGDRISFLMAQSARVTTQVLVYGGLEKLKVGNRTVECHRFSQMAPKTEKGRTVEEEQVWIYVQDNAERTPVEIDFLMKTGMTRARLSE